jgi:hypothetical protein
MEFIVGNLDKDWDWYYISRHPSITIKFILEHSGYPWNWYAVSQNPGIKMADIIDNSDNPWNWHNISLNTFEKEKEDFMIQEYRKHLAALRIQNAYRNALVNPSCQVGLNRMERDMVFAGII